MPTPPTLYDLLEVSQTASAETIRANYQRMHSECSSQAGEPGDDATNRMIALREAYATLGDPSRRKRYDEKLQMHESFQAVDSGKSSSLGRWFLVLLFVGGCYWGYSNHLEKKELARIELAKQAEAARVAEQQRQAEDERKALIASSKLEDEHRRQRYEEQLAREREIAYGRQISREIEMAENRRVSAANMEQQRRTREESQRQAEAERQLARDKATLRRLEAENNRW